MGQRGRTVSRPFQPIMVNGRWYVVCLLNGRWTREQPSNYAHGVSAMCNRFYHMGAHH